MGLLRALSTTKGRRGGYDRLLDETKNDGSGVSNQGNAVLKRAISVPARVLFGSSSRKIKTTSSSSSSSSSSQTSVSSNNNCNKSSKQQEEKNKGGKVHPVFGLFDGRSWSKRKFSANPDFSRYVEYLKEGGVGSKVQNKDVDAPVIYNNSMRNNHTYTPTMVFERPM